MEGPLNAIKMPDALSQRDLRISSVNAKVTYENYLSFNYWECKILSKQGIIIENFIFLHRIVGRKW